MMWEAGSSTTGRDRTMQSGTEAAPTEIGPAPDGPARPRRLVVLVPGLHGHGGGQLENWAPLEKRLAGEEGYKPAETRWIGFAHGVKRWGTEPIESVAERLRGRIDAEWLRAGGFDDVVLVGHSMGGLIVRQAYLLAAGAVPGQQASAWACRVRRIVLFASLNRGVDPKKKPQWGMAN